MKDPFKVFLFRLSLGVWVVSSLLRFWNVGLFAGLSYDDCAYATSGKDLIEQGHGYWGDTLRPFNSWWVALLHQLRGISIVNVAIAFATVRSLGELFLLLTARRLFPKFLWAPFMVVLLSSTSFLGSLYGKQHLSSLLMTIPLSLWLYSRYLDTQKWRDWLCCAAAAGLVFLSHYNTIAPLGFMLGFEMFRLHKKNSPIKKILSLGMAGIATCFVVATQLGTLTYRMKVFGYFKSVRDQVSQSQGKGPIELSDGFLFSLGSWEGIAFVLYILGLLWMIHKCWKSSDETTNRWVAITWVPLLGMGLVWIRVSLGFMSFPRLYVFALPFLWLITAGWLASVIHSRSESTASSDSLPKCAAGLAALLALLVSAGHHYSQTSYSVAHQEIEAYLRHHPTKKMVIWNGNPHLALFWFGWNYGPMKNTKAEMDAHWADSMNGSKFDEKLPPEVADPNNRIYLNRDDLSRVCDLIILYGVSIEILNTTDAKIREKVPAVKVVDFYQGALQSIPLMADECGLLSGKLSFTKDSRLPMIRIYDLRGDLP